MRTTFLSQRPDSPAQAMAAIESLAGHPNGHWIQPGRRHWELFALLCRQTQATGKHVAHAQHAATAIEHAVATVQDLLQQHPGAQAYEPEPIL